MIPSDITQLILNDRATEKSIRAASYRFGEMIAEAGVWFDMHPDFAPFTETIGPRRGIMEGRPPDHDRMVAARVAMAERGRTAVADVRVRGMG